MEADIDGLVQDRSNSSALGMDLLQFCTKPSIYNSQRIPRECSTYQPRHHLIPRAPFTNIV